MIKWILNLQIKSPNKRYWKIPPRTQAGIESKSKNSNRGVIHMHWIIEPIKPQAPCVVQLERLYNPSKCQKKWDNDNWIAACKEIRDTLADLLVPGYKTRGHADNEKHGIQWEYTQSKSTQKGVRIIIIEEWELKNLCQQIPTYTQNGL